MMVDHLVFCLDKPPYSQEYSQHQRSSQYRWHNQTSSRFLRNKVWEELSWSKHLYKTESSTYGIIFCHKSRNRMTFMNPIDLKAKGIVKYEKGTNPYPCCLNQHGKFQLNYQISLLDKTNKNKSLHSLHCVYAFNKPGFLLLLSTLPLPP